MKTTMKKAVSYLSGPGHFGRIVTGIIVWLPGPVSRDSSLTSQKFDFSNCFPGLVAADNELVS